MALGLLFLRTFVKSQLHAACLFSFEMNNCVLTVHDRSITLAMDLCFVAVNGQDSRPHDRHPRIPSNRHAME